MFSTWVRAHQLSAITFNLSWTLDLPNHRKSLFLMDDRHSALAKVIMNRIITQAPLAPSQHYRLHNNSIK